MSASQGLAKESALVAVLLSSLLAAPRVQPLFRMCHTDVCLLCLAQDIDHDGDGTLLYEVRRLQGDCRW